MTTGKRLRAAREAKGMSLGDIARRTYIQPKFLQAIDDDDFSQIPSSHRKLFVREYAKVIGLDSADLLDEIDEYAPPASPVNNVEPSPAWQTAPAGGESGGTASAPPPVVDHERGGEYREVLRRLSTGRGVKLSGPNTSRWLIGIALVLLVLAGLYYFFFRKEAPAEATTPAAREQVDSAAAATGATTEGATDTASHAATPSAPTGQIGDSLTLEGRANSKVWFSLVMDGKRSDQGTLDSGGTRTWRAAETFKLSLGNAGGLELSLNEKSIGVLGPRKSLVRNQVIDANGLRKGPAHRPTTTSGTTPPATAAPATGTAPKPAKVPARTKPTARRAPAAAFKPITPTEVRRPAIQANGTHP